MKRRPCADATPGLLLYPRALQPRRICIAAEAMVRNKYSSLLLKSEPGFHAEWLRDGPCDATTTGPSNSGHRCQLSPAVKSGVHEIRGAAVAHLANSQVVSQVSSSSRVPVFVS